ncbi:MAG: hypothetical protein LBP19_05265 [Treponema sp.]|jgi:hypothetical protein|nr:hypothetical protein [Treponema sp.]
MRLDPNNPLPLSEELIRFINGQNPTMQAIKFAEDYSIVRMLALSGGGIQIDIVARNMAEEANSAALNANTRAMESQQLVAEEETRAKEKENTIHTAVEEETARAQAEEQQIRGEIEDEVSRAQAAESAIAGATAAEIARAESAETSLQTSISEESELREDMDIYSIEYNQTTHEIRLLKGNSSILSLVLLVASDTTDGLMSKENHQSIAANVQAISAETTRAESAEAANAQAIADLVIETGKKVNIIDETETFKKTCYANGTVKTEWKANGSLTGSYDQYFADVDDGGYQHYDHETDTLSFCGSNSNQSDPIVYQVYVKNRTTNIGNRLTWKWTGASPGLGEIKTYYTSGRNSAAVTGDDEVQTKDMIVSYISKLTMYQPYDLSFLTLGTVIDRLTVDTGAGIEGHNSVDYNTTNGTLQVYIGAAATGNPVPVDKETRSTVTATIDGQTQDYYITASDIWEPLGVALTDYYKKYEIDTKIQTIETLISGKQATLTAEQVAAVNSGITTDKVNEYDEVVNEAVRDSQIETAEPTEHSTDEHIISAKQLWNILGGALSTLKTTDKTIISAINELFDKVPPQPELNQEVLTGKYWYDGKPIYCYVTNGTIVAAANTAVSTTIRDANIVDTLTLSSGWLMRGNNAYKYVIPAFSINNNESINAVFVRNADGTINLNSLSAYARTGTTNNEYEVYLEYTKL